MIVCVLWWAYIQFWSNASEKEDVSAKREADWSFQKPKVPETKLTDQEECALCGSRKGSMTGMFSGKDAIGIISVNDWYIMDLKIKSGNEKGNMPEDTEGKNTTRTTVGKNGRVLERSSESLRGISEIVVDYGEDRVLSMEKASQILCQSCLEKLSEAMEVKCEEGKYGLLRTTCSHNPTQDSHIVVLTPHFYVHIGAGHKVILPLVCEHTWCQTF